MVKEKACPYCAELIKAAAVKCRYCGSKLPTQKKVGAGQDAPIPFLGIIIGLVFLVVIMWGMMTKSGSRKEDDSLFVGSIITDTVDEEAGDNSH